VFSQKSPKNAFFVSGRVFQNIQKFRVFTVKTMVFAVQHGVKFVTDKFVGSWKYGKRPDIHNRAVAENQTNRKKKILRPGG